MPKPRKPTAVKKAQGTSRKCRELPDEMLPSVVGGVPDPPAILAKNRQAMKLWQESVVELHNLGMLHNVDLAMLAAYCMKMELFFRMTEFCEKNGYVDDRGKRRAQSLEARDALDQANKIAQQFGFVPAARTKISMPKKEEGGEFFD